MPNIEEVLRLKTEGFTNKEIAEKLSVEGEEPLTYQMIGKIIKDNTPKDTTPKVVTKKSKAVKGKVVDKPQKFFKTMTQPEYEEYSLANGRTRYGGEKGVKVNATIEELRAYINSGWKPSMLLEKWQMTEEELKQLTWKLAKAELRDRQPTINYKQDFFRF